MHRESFLVVVEGDKPLEVAEIPVLSMLVAGFKLRVERLKPESTTRPPPPEEDE